MRARSVQALAALTVLAAILRFSTLDVQSYWFDEAVTVGLVKSSFGHMLSSIGGSESTPPLYYMIAWVWSRAFGDGEVGLRSLSALAGTAFVPVAYAAAAELSSRRTALLVAALAAVSPLLIWYSQEARSYSLLVLFAGLSFLFFLRQLRQPRDSMLALWTLASGLAIATHYFAGFLVAPEAAWLVLRAHDRRRPAVAIGALLLVAGALLPILIRQRRLDLTSFITQTSLAKRAAQVAKQFIVGYASPAETAVTVIGALLVAYGLWLAYSRLVDRERRSARLALFVGLTAVGVPILLALLGADYLDTRNVLAAWLPLLVVPAMGYAARQAGRSGLAAFALLCALSLFVTVSVWANTSYQRDDVRGLARALGKPTVPRAIVLTPVSASVPLRVYLSPFVQPGEPVLVREIDLAALPIRSGVFSGAKPPPRKPGYVLPVAGMKLVEQRFTKTYSLLRYRSAIPIQIGPPALLFNRLDARPAAVIYQR
jgi:mannosyltransferase